MTRILKNYGTDGVIHFDELVEFYELSYENQAEKVMKEFEKRGWKPPEKKKNRRLIDPISSAGLRCDSSPWGCWRSTATTAGRSSSPRPGE